MNTLTRTVDLLDVEKEYRGNKGLAGEPFISGLLQLEGRIYGSAKQEYERVLHIDPNSTGGLINFGNALVGLDQPDTALKYYQKALKLEPNNEVALKNIAVLLIKKGKHEKACEVLSDLLKRNPSDADVHGLLGSYSTELGDYGKAIEYFTKAVQLGTGKGGFYVDLIYLYEELKHNYAKAIEIAEEATRRFPLPSQLLLNNFAFALIKAGRLDEAWKVLQAIKVEKDSPDYSLVLATTGLYYLTGHDLEGNKYYTKAKNEAVNPSLKNLIKQRHLYELGEYYYRIGNYKEARDRWLTALRVKVLPRPPDASPQILQALQRLEELETKGMGQEIKRNVEITISPKGLGVEVALDWLFNFLACVITEVKAKKVRISYKENGRYITRLTASQKVLTFLSAIKQQLLEPSFMMEWDGERLYSGGFGCFFLETPGFEDERKKKLAELIREATERLNQYGLKTYPQWQSASK